jgi:hypothetical protein
MIVGYFFESILGLIFALGFSVKEALSTGRPFTKNRNLLAKGCKTFFDCAIFFVASIQIACFIVLVRKNSGISADGLGGLTVQIAWAVALLCMLPLLYPMVVLEYTKKEKSNYRFFLFCGCWILYLYVFVSQMVGYFAPSQVGQGAGPSGTTIITTEDWNSVTSLCLNDTQPLSKTEQTVLSAFGAAGSILVSLYGLVYLVWFIIQRQSHRQARWIRSKVRSIPNRYRTSTVAIRGLVVLIPILTIPQFWGVIRLRGVQKALAKSTNNPYTDNQWTFGQVVAVMIFAPVFTEVGYSWIQDHREHHPFKMEF